MKDEAQKSAEGGGKGRKLSYKTFPTTEPSPDGITFRPMEHLVQQDRSHRRMIFCLATVFLVAVLGLASWIFEFQLHTRRSCTESTLIVQRANQVERASQAVHRMNKHHHRQGRDLWPGCETTVLIMRHCEKSGPGATDENGDGHCSYLGYERAEFIPSLFGSVKRWPNPSFLYAYEIQRKKKKVYRQWETLLPLSKQIHVDIQLISHSVTAFADDVFIPQLQSGELCGKLSLISWKHSEFPSLANSLGCGPENGCPTEYPGDSFDLVWQIKLVYNATVSSHPKGSWAVYGSVSQQNFDPLSFSHKAGDYPEGGSPSGGRWATTTAMFEL